VINRSLRVGTGFLDQFIRSDEREPINNPTRGIWFFTAGGTYFMAVGVKCSS
jgi:hypothetical protein